MSVGINTNNEALSAVRQLSKTSGMVSEAMGRLSSGKRVNTAADDAAGLAIISNLDRQITGTQQAIRNSNEGISLVEVMDSALEEVNSLYQRARQLAVYSANETLSATDRDSLNAEYQQIVGAGGEAERILTKSSFNGVTLLDGSAIDLQVGWEAGDVTTVTGVDFSGTTATIGAIDGADATNATAELAVLDTAIDSVVSFRADLGAYQNRFESTISNLESLSEKTQVAKGRIQDADFATESTNLARAQVLQQAGMGMLSRANSSAQQVMQLLQQ
ncbi:flagellin [Pseudoalteromonas marina]|uniref:Flagellin n=2 Tax=Bacteria TaxID=2 RepID=A0ABT9FCE1_9GAMM|nr:flagellin [Pseudoalteromonas marina]MDP2564344.1 flagellin [Pseudoalteromonas marina]